ncbi:MAG TPA: FAD-dependent oxidoreductase [Vicinamibacterales bacterium]|jgi:2-polyprenyl-6-methoxyphenol hydroxylase-like FAD-dependent oxidoreductase|nr:FAD-dependent oxidoreductase [Vicinamibacterales bacterium]
MRILVIGGGICGLGTALLLGRDGHEVTLLERDADPIPASSDAAWDHWQRKGVAQFRQPHNFMPGLRLLLEAELPEIQEALGRAGAARFDLVNPLPPIFADRAPRPIDEKLWTLTARRPVGEWVFARAAEHARGVSIRRGVGVEALLTGASAIDGIPHVAGVRTSDADELRADLVVDATGRQSRSPQWLMAIGARPPYEEQEDCGFTYYTRYFRGVQPQRLGGALTPLGSISLLTLPGDRDTWSVTIFVTTGDQPLKGLRHEEPWMAAIGACPLQAHWLQGEPISPVLAMSGIADRYRRFVVDDTPVATGFAAVADAWACTNPSAGRGLTVGFLHALRLRDALRTHGDDPRALVEEFDRRTQAEITPWYEAQIAVDRARFGEMVALREGREPPPPAHDLARRFGGLMSSIAASPDLFRDALEYIGTVTPLQQILERPVVIQRMAAAREALKGTPRPPTPGPTRSQLLEIASRV